MDRRKNGPPRDPVREGGVKTERSAPADTSREGGMAGEAEPGGEASVTPQTAEPARGADRRGGMLGEG